MQRARTYADVNAVVGGYLRDLAFAQSSKQKMFGYKRAAAAILSLDTPLTDLLGPDGALPRIPGIGPGSMRVIREILETGASPTVEQAVERRRELDGSCGLRLGVRHPGQRPGLLDGLGLQGEVVDGPYGREPRPGALIRADPGGCGGTARAFPVGRL